MSSGLGFKFLRQKKYSSFRASFFHLLQRLRRLIFNEAGNLDTGFHHHRLGWIHNSPVVLSRENSEATLALKDPILVGGEHLHHYAPRSVWRLQNSVFDFRTGMTYLNGHVVREAGGTGTKGVSKWRFAVLSSPRVIQGTAICFSQKPPNYYHFLVEDLPAIIRAKESVPKAILYIAAGLPDYVSQLLEVFKIEFRQAPQEKFVVREQILAGFGQDSGWPNPRDIDLLRKHMPKVATTPGEKKIFVSRRFEKRTFKNEHLLCQFLEEKGFLTLNLDGMKAEDQVSHFANAAVVVGVHGAGLSNIVFSAPSVRVLEIAFDWHAINCFEIISTQLGQDFRRMIVKGTAPFSRPTLEEDILRRLVSAI